MPKRYWTAASAAATLALAAGLLGAAPAAAENAPVEAPQVRVDPQTSGLFFVVEPAQSALNPVVTVEVTAPGTSRVETRDVCQLAFSTPTVCTSKRFPVFVDGLGPETDYRWTVTVATSRGPLAPVSGITRTLPIPKVQFPIVEPSPTPAPKPESTPPPKPRPAADQTPAAPAKAKVKFLRRGAVRDLSVHTFTDRSRTFLLLSARKMTRVVVAARSDGRWRTISSSVPPQGMGSATHASVKVPTGRSLRVRVVTESGRCVFTVRPAR